MNRGGERTAAELIPGSLKRSKSYSSELEHLTRKQLEGLGKPDDVKAKKMLELIQEASRLLAKVRSRVP